MRHIQFLQCMRSGTKGFSGCFFSYVEVSFGVLNAWNAQVGLGQLLSKNGVRNSRQDQTILGSITCQDIVIT